MTMQRAAPVPVPKAAAAAPPLLIVIVNFRTPDLTIECLRSLAPEVAALQGTRVVVVENGSGDESAARLAAAIAREGWGDWAFLHVEARNGGFAGGNNRGLEAAARLEPAQYVLLLNSDTIVHAGCLRRCFGTMEAEPAIGVMSCRLLNADGSVQNVARRFPTPIRQFLQQTGLTWRLPRVFAWADTEDPGWDRRTTRRHVDWLGGAFLFIRGDLLRKIGGLDEKFFFYGEDIEFCSRVHRAGFRCLYDPAASITHLGGSSSDPTRLAAAKRSVHAWRARYLVQRLCHGRPAAAFVRAVDIVSYASRAAALRLLGRGSTEKYAEMRDILRLISRPLRP